MIDNILADHRLRHGPLYNWRHITTLQSSPVAYHALEYRVPIADTSLVSHIIIVIAIISSCGSPRLLLLLLLLNSCIFYHLLIVHWLLDGSAGHHISESPLEIDANLLRDGGTSCEYAFLLVDLSSAVALRDEFLESCVFIQVYNVALPSGELLLNDS